MVIEFKMVSERVQKKTVTLNVVYHELDVFEYSARAHVHIFRIEFHVRRRRGTEPNGKNQRKTKLKNKTK